MKINELKIGNWLYDHLNRKIQVKGLKEDYVYCNLSNGEKLKCHINTFKPILLTEKILLDLGFEKFTEEDDSRSIYYGLQLTENIFLCYAYDFSLAIFQSKQRMDDDFGVLPEYELCKYLHTLQNIVFTLIGKEILQYV